MALMKDKNGIYLKEEQISDIRTQFSAQLQDEYFDIEDNSWWFRYKSEVIQYLVEKYFDRSSRSFDIGGGNGYIASRLVKAGYDIGLIEPAYEACLNAQKRGVPYVVNGSIGDIDYNIMQCTCLDVLEHVEDDRHFLNAIYQKMETGGKLILTVPAFMSLWSSEDVKLGHFRRYRRKQLEALFKSIGFEVTYSSYSFWFLFIPILIVRVILEKFGIIKDQGKCSDEDNAMREAQQHRPPKGIVGVILGLVERAELWMLKKECVVPFGSSVIVVAEKK